MDKAQENIRRAFQLMRDVAANPDHFPDRFVAIPLDPKMIAGIFTEERIRLLKEIREQGPFHSVGQLASRVHRDETRVSRDLRFLVDAGLASTRRRGKAKEVSGTNRPIVIQ